MIKVKEVLVFLKINRSVKGYVLEKKKEVIKVKKKYYIVDIFIS